MIITNQLAVATAVVVTSRSLTVVVRLHRKRDGRLPFPVNRSECPSSGRFHRFPVSSHRTIVRNGRPGVRSRKTNEKTSPKSECIRFLGVAGEF